MSPADVIQHPHLKALVEFVRVRPALRRALIILWHTVGLFLAYGAAYLLRFDGSVPANYSLTFWHTLPVMLLVYLGVFAAFRLYSGMWAFFSVDDVVRVGLALCVGTLCFGIIIFALHGLLTHGFPRSVFVLTPLLMGFWITSARLAVRYVRRWRTGERASELKPNERLLIVGQPDDADILVRAANSSGLGTLVGIVTGDPRHVGLQMHGIPIRGAVDQIGTVAAATRANCILVLPPFNRPRQLNEIVEQCAAAGVACTFRQIPGMGELAGGSITASSIRDVEVDDLLGRGAQIFDRTEVRRFVKGKRVMVTGAGGSIGSELCRQLATYEPAVLVLFELSEIALYTIEQELSERYPSLPLLPCAGDIRSPEDVEAAIDAAGGLDIIYHAAAYKHVPLMEQNVPACFRTNVLGTASLATVARQRRVDRFVMISSDKAVRPTSMMGATKRFAEQVVNSMATAGTSFVSVRFGNVLGSSGSVIPRFKQQIVAGGPVTVTTPEMRRFFMTIPEAVDLVLMAGTIGRSGDVMVLEMGESIRIVDLARRLIELSGLVPDRDIRIEFTGRRPGEKDFEEVMTLDENVVRTAFEKIWVLNRQTSIAPMPPVDLELVTTLVTRHDAAGLRALAARLVPDNCFEHVPQGITATSTGEPS